jgi:ATP-binding cassette subfamily B protein
MFLVACIWAIDISLRPYLLKIILNRLDEGSQQAVFNYLAGPIILYLGMYFLLTNAFRLYDYFVDIKMIPQMRKNMVHDALEKLLDKSHAYYQNAFSGALTNKVNDLATNVPELIQILIDRFFTHALTVAVAIFTLSQVNMRFALGMLVWTLFFIVGALFFSKRLTKQADAWSECRSIVTGKIVDVLSNILSVRLFAAKKEEKNALNQTLQKTMQAEQEWYWSYFWMWLSYGYSFFVLQLFNFYFLCKGRQEGWVTVGDFALVLMLNISIIDFLWELAHEFSNFSKLYGRVTQALRVLVDQAELKDSKDASVLKVRQGQIVFDNVTFQYAGAKPLFHNQSVTIPGGQKVGLVGYSGGGKSTFVNLILRFYDVTDGRILIDGQNIRKVTQDSLRRHIAMIPQDPSLFHRSLMDNIRYGKAESTDQEVMAAAEKAQAHAFISKLPQGYASLVGERGVKLSGGQRQRIAIARAILKNAPILILDEATSQLDSVTESGIQESLWELMQNKTTIVIAHRLSTLLHMDRILVFDQGKIVEDGTHAELLAIDNGLYKTLWEAQVGGFLPG